MRAIVVDDEPLVREWLSRALRKGGFEVEEFADGRVALERLAASPVALVLLDWMLPELSGLNVLERIRADGRNDACRVVMVTGLSQAEAALVASVAGADGYLMKPTSTVELRAEIERLGLPYRPVARARHHSRGGT